MVAKNVTESPFPKMSSSKTNLKAEGGIEGIAVAQCALPLSVGKDIKNSATDTNKMVKEASSGSLTVSERELELL